MGDSLKGLKPEGFFKWFEEICRIPHVMGHEEQISLFLESFAKERGLACVRDEMGNILIRVPATGRIRKRTVDPASGAYGYGGCAG